MKILQFLAIHNCFPSRPVVTDRWATATQVYSQLGSGPLPLCFSRAPEALDPVPPVRYLKTDMEKHRDSGHATLLGDPSLAFSSRTPT